MSNSDFLFRLWPYVALAVFGLGLAVRYLRSTRRDLGWTSLAHSCCT